MDIITRQEAREQGLTHYFTGKTCVHGHVDIRSTSTKICKSNVQGCTLPIMQNHLLVKITAESMPKNIGKKQRSMA